MSRSIKKRWTLFGALIGIGSTLALVIGLGVFAGAGAAASSAKPANSSPPTITGTAQEGSSLTGNRGTWDNNPTSYDYFWMRCGKNGGSCSDISGARSLTYTLKGVDVGNTLRFRVRAQNADGQTSATSVPTAVVIAATKPPPPAPATGCPTGTGSIQVANLTSPALLLIDQQQTSPSVVNSGTNQLIVRYHVSACKGRSVQGSLVYATAVPFNQLSIPAEQATGPDGWAELDFHMLAFPVSPKQQLIAIFARARKSGENLLGGISSRRLFSVGVNLRG